MHYEAHVLIVVVELSCWCKRFMGVCISKSYWAWPKARTHKGTWEEVPLHSRFSIRLLSSHLSQKLTSSKITPPPRRSPLAVVEPRSWLNYHNHEPFHILYPFFNLAFPKYHPYHCNPNLNANPKKFQIKIKPYVFMNPKPNRRVLNFAIIFYNLVEEIEESMKDWEANYQRDWGLSQSLFHSSWRVLSLRFLQILLLFFCFIFLNLWIIWLLIVVVRIR